MKENERSYIKKMMSKFSSPFFYYDLDQLETLLESITKAFHPHIKLCYAVKANPLSSILKIIRNHRVGIDVASVGELEQSIRAGVSPEDILSTGPSKSKEFLQKLLRESVMTIVVESFEQLRLLEELAKEYGRTPQIILRLQIDWKMQEETIIGGDEITPFGLDTYAWSQLNLKDYPHLKVKGLHVFQWGNVLDLARLKMIWTRSIRKMIVLADHLKFDLEIVDLGGGLGIPYSSSERAVKIEDVSDILIGLKKELNIGEIWMELGRFITGPIGKYFAQIVDRKTVRRKELLVMDGGINHISRSALTKTYFPCQSFSSEPHSSRINFQICGPLCTSLDIIGNADLPSHLKPGDWLIFNQTGAYAFTESMPFFLCHTLPGEVISYRGDFMIPRLPKPASDWLV